MVRPIKQSSSPNEVAHPQSFAYGTPISYGFPPPAPSGGNKFEVAPPHGQLPSQLPQGFHAVRPPHSQSAGSSYSSPRTSGMSSESSRNTPDKNEHPYAQMPAGLAMPAMASPSPGGSPWRYRPSTGGIPQFHNGELHWTGLYFTFLTDS